MGAAIAALNDPHICTLHDVGEHPSTGSGQATFYPAMEYLTGETPADRLGRGPMPLEQALAVATDIADAPAIELHPLSVGPRINLGIHLYYAGRLGEAAAAFTKGLELSPDYPITRALLGRVLVLQGRPQEALAEIEREPDEVWRRYGLCLAYHAAGRAKQADAALATPLTRETRERNLRSIWTEPDHSARHRGSRSCAVTRLPAQDGRARLPGSIPSCCCCC